MDSRVPAFYAPAVADAETLAPIGLPPCPQAQRSAARERGAAVVNSALEVPDQVQELVDETLQELAAVGIDNLVVGAE